MREMTINPGRLALLVTCLIAASILDAGCQAKITERIDGKTDGSAVAHVLIDMDDQFYNLASQQHNGGFDQDFPVSDGWQVVKTANGGQHRIDASRNLPAGSIASWFKMGESSDERVGFASSATPTLSVKKGLFTDTYALTAHINPPAPPTNGGSADSASAQAALGMISTIFSFNLQLAIPGKLVSTNGEVEPDGAVNWVVSMQNPTDLLLVTSQPDYSHIWIAIGVFVLVGIALAVKLMRRL